MTIDRTHLWMGREVNDQQLVNELESIVSATSAVLNKTLRVSDVISACDRLALRIDTGKSILNEALGQSTSEISGFLKKDNLIKKIQSELISLDFADLKRVRFDRDIFESYAPLGVLAHVTPGNAAGLSLLATVEGLLTGNLNILKLSSKEDNTTVKALIELIEEDKSNTLKDFIIALKIGSNEKDKLERIFSYSDGISVWGGDAAIQNVKQMAPVGTRIIPWGHKISFAYVSRECLQDESQLKKLAYDCVLGEQQACSSPQCIYIESNDFEEVKTFTKYFSSFMKIESDKVPVPEHTIQEDAELTNISELAKLDQVFELTYVAEDTNKDWRLIAEQDNELKPSPLNRTVWIKGLMKDEIVKKLMPWRSYLQTASLLGTRERTPELASLLIRAGVTRVTPAGEMLVGYEGEPHDGEYALLRFMKRVRAELKGAEGIFRLSDFDECHFASDPVMNKEVPVMSKADFQAAGYDDKKSKLFFRSGGSSGKPALSPFSYDDYHAQMNAAAEGLYAAGLSPETDRVVNLFFGGGLYGGFLSFFSILEHIKAVHYPMAAHEDLNFAGDIIVDGGINVLLGMPSYIVSLIQANLEKFKHYGKIEKIFFGGEHFSKKQREWIEEELGISIIRSASYGSVDAGPLGFQCPHSSCGVHHLNHNLHSLEILKMNEDLPVSENEIGRLVFTSKKRECINIIRYDLGDLGRWVPGRCKCGRVSLRFELMGRYGDIFRAAGTFVNFNKISRLLVDECDYAGEAQVVITKNDLKDSLVLRLDKKFATDIDYVNTILKNYHDLNEVVVIEKNLLFSTEIVPASEMIHTESSGKLVRVKDLR